jgi:hypothetical protein
MKIDRFNVVTGPTGIIGIVATVFPAAFSVTLTRQRDAFPGPNLRKARPIHPRRRHLKAIRRTGPNLPIGGQLFDGLSDWAAHLSRRTAEKFKNSCWEQSPLGAQ